MEWTLDLSKEQAAQDGDGFQQQEELIEQDQGNNNLMENFGGDLNRKKNEAILDPTKEGEEPEEEIRNNIERNNFINTNNNNIDNLGVPVNDRRPPLVGRDDVSPFLCRNCINSLNILLLFLLTTGHEKYSSCDHFSSSFVPISSVGDFFEEVLHPLFCCFLLLGVYHASSGHSGSSSIFLFFCCSSSFSYCCYWGCRPIFDRCVARFNRQGENDVQQPRTSSRQQCHC
jgi:hypothetical protein